MYSLEDEDLFIRMTLRVLKYEGQFYDKNNIESMVSILYIHIHT